MSGRNGLWPGFSPSRNMYAGAERGSDVVRAMIVDDEADMRLLIRMTLTLEAGIDVAAEASSGPEAVRVWHDIRPDVVVLDMRMPGMTGIETARAILELDPTQPIVMCSAWMDLDARAEAHRLGASCVDKIDIATLPATIHRAAKAAA